MLARGREGTTLVGAASTRMERALENLPATTTQLDEPDVFARTTAGSQIGPGACRSSARGYAAAVARQLELDRARLDQRLHGRGLRVASSWSERLCVRGTAVVSVCGGRADCVRAQATRRRLASRSRRPGRRSRRQLARHRDWRTASRREGAGRRAQQRRFRSGAFGACALRRRWAYAPSAPAHQLVAVVRAERTNGGSPADAATHAGPLRQDRRAAGGSRRWIVCRAVHA